MVTASCRKEEVPPRMAERFDQMDSNQDGSLDQERTAVSPPAECVRSMGSPQQGRPHEGGVDLQGSNPSLARIGSCYFDFNG